MLPPQIRHLLIHAMIKGKELIEEKIRESKNKK
jgi:hypothetical protein